MCYYEPSSSSVRQIYVMCINTQGVGFCDNMVADSFVTTLWSTEDTSGRTKPKGVCTVSRKRAGIPWYSSTLRDRGGPDRNVKRFVRCVSVHLIPSYLALVQTRISLVIPSSSSTSSSTRCTPRAVYRSLLIRVVYVNLYTFTLCFRLDT